MPIDAYAVMAAGKELEKFRYDPKELGPHDIEVKITHCGICHSDIHLIDDDWKMSSFPLVPGHEIIGTVTSAGASVTAFEPGQRVGIGWQRSSCLECELCRSGQENLCPSQRATCAGHYGGFATSIRADSRFVFAIPEALASENAAPLLCGGATVYSPLRNHGVRATMKVGVIGIGGLGHLALQFARAIGCEVTAFSSSPDKQKAAESFGAHHFVSSKEKGELEKMTGTQDFIINTVFVGLDWARYLDILRPNGTLCFVGAPQIPIRLPVFPLLVGQKSVCGSVIGSRSGIREMLELAARHGIVAKTEATPMDQVNAALTKVRENQARYRMVLTN